MTEQNNAEYISIEEWLDGKHNEYDTETRREQMEREIGSLGESWVSEAWARGFDWGYDVGSMGKQHITDVEEMNADAFFRGLSAGIAVSIIAAAILTVVL